MNIVERIKNNNLPTKQLRVIESILDDLESNSFLSGNELCEKFKISFSSLTRLAKSLQYNGFPELKKDIEMMYKTEFSPSQQAEIYSITDKDLVIAFSINKELIEFQDFFNSLQSKNIFSVLFTDKKAGRLRKLANYSFYASSTGHGMINCLTPYIVSTNILESILFSMDKHVHLAKIRNIEKNWNSLPIFLN